MKKQLIVNAENPTTKLISVASWTLLAQYGTVLAKM